MGGVGRGSTVRRRVEAFGGVLEGANKGDSEGRDGRDGEILKTETAYGSG